MKTPNDAVPTPRPEGRILPLILAAAMIVAVTGCQSKSPRCACQAPGAAAAVAAAPGGASTNKPAAALAEDEELLFDGKTLKGWVPTDFAGKGEVEVKDGAIQLREGVMTGVNYTNPVPKMDYEVSYDACRVSGSDFFASLTFPVGDSWCTLITGGWGGGVVGLSSLDNMDASENETTQFVNFENGKWYNFRVRVTKNKIEAWIDGKQIIKVNTTEKRVSLRPGEIEASKPFGFATWSTAGAIKNIKLKRLD